MCMCAYMSVHAGTQLFSPAGLLQRKTLEDLEECMEKDRSCHRSQILTGSFVPVSLPCLSPSGFTHASDSLLWNLGYGWHTGLEALEGDASTALGGPVLGGWEITSLPQA